MANTTNRKISKLAPQGQQYEVANEDFDAVDSMLSNLMSIAMTADHTIANATGSPGVAGEMESQALGYKLAGTLSADRILTVPFTMIFMVWNTTSGAHTITVKSGAGTTVEVEQGSAVLLYSDATNVVAVTVPGLAAALDAKADASAVSGTYTSFPTSMTFTNGVLTAVTP